MTPAIQMRDIQSVDELGKKLDLAIRLGLLGDGAVLAMPAALAVELNRALRIARAIDAETERLKTAGAEAGHTLDRAIAAMDDVQRLIDGHERLLLTALGGCAPGVADCHCREHSNDGAAVICPGCHRPIDARELQVQPGPKPDSLRLDAETELAVLIAAQMALTLYQFAQGSAGHAMLRDLARALPAEGGAGRLRLALIGLAEARDPIGWELAKEGARAAVMPFLRSMSAAALTDQVAQRLKVG